MFLEAIIWSDFSPFFFRFLLEENYLLLSAVSGRSRYVALKFIAAESLR